MFVPPVLVENLKDKEIKLELVEKPQEVHNKISKLKFLDELKKKQGNKKPALIKQIDLEQKKIPSEKEVKDEYLEKKSDLILSKAEMKKQPNKEEPVSVELMQVEDEIETVEEIKTG